MSDYPRKFDELTPEQHAALVELGRKMAEHMQSLAEAFSQLAAACVEAQRNIEAARLNHTDPPDPGDSP